VIELPLRLAAARAHLAIGRRADAERGLRVAMTVLERRAALIPQTDVRALFLGEVPEHAALRALAATL
jgi:hypothetical protein